MYDNSVIILTADHGESLGDWGRHGHISIAPEIMRIPLIIHLPGALRKQLVWDARKPVFLEDITPTIYYLAGHRNLKEGEMLGQPLFTSADEQPRPAAKHYFMMSSYMPVFGILTGDEHGLYIVDASLHHSAFYDLEHDPTASENKITAPLKKRYQALIREDLEKIDHFYQVQIGQAAEAHQK
jgi:arylsulfatase A-like enzyme